MNENIEELSNLETIQMEPFRNDLVQMPVVDNIDMNLAQKAALRSKRRKVSMGIYADLNFIPPTSNVVERLFSTARLVLTDYRKSMSPSTFECVMFLKFNSSLWDLNLVSKIIKE